MVAITIGVGGAIGPLMGGLLSQSIGWQAIFAVNSAAAATIPIAYRILPRQEDRSGGQLDTPGALALGLLVAGVLLFASEGARVKWDAALALVGAGGGAIGLLILVARQLTADSPLAATISRLVRVQVLASALSINSMLFFLGGSIGTALLVATATRSGGTSPDALNPLHLGAGAGYSDAFLLLTLPALAVLVLSLALPKAQLVAVAIPTGVPEPAAAEQPHWVHDCSMPWAPACQEASAVETCAALPVDRPVS